MDVTRSAYVANGWRLVESVMEYTALTRDDLGPCAAQPGDSVVLGNLLVECATFPEAIFEWADREWDPRWVPEVFASRVLGVTVPVGSVLELCGIMADEGRGAVLTVESLTPQCQVVFACHIRRFALFLTQAGAAELCPVPGCSAGPIHEHIFRCRRHLVDCDVDEPARMAREYGGTRREELDRDPARMAGDPHADLLAKAAAAHGAAEPVNAAYLDGLFDPEMIDEIHWDPTEALAMRHALEREGLRLRRVADTETRLIRARIKNCTTCGGGLSPWAVQAVPPYLCAGACVPSAADVRALTATG
ncbi:hypothetical protein [Embleya sp. NBC_00896]|uniref:hypothetical protein n=1 Tax=Embleya sp. NBC_00896 TaxID=2975961 RepID=UPI00386F3249|nr:hypothetical protein OG928_45170 [Embleya sp. NBC_00896]